MNEWKIYTRKGDGGKTSLLGGVMVPKHDDRIEAYGTVDELNSYIALLHDYSPDNWVNEILLEVEDRLFTIESQLAAATEADMVRLPLISEADIKLLEHSIDKMNETLPPITSFVLPGGHLLNSYAHIARTVCRRAERCVSRMNVTHEQHLLGLKYLNRLSDFLFVLARKFSFDNGANEISWKPRI